MMFVRGGEESRQPSVESFNYSVITVTVNAVTLLHRNNERFVPGTSMSALGPGDPTCPCINATALLIGLSTLSVIPNRTDVTDRHSNLGPTDLQIG